MDDLVNELLKQVALNMLPATYIIQNVRERLGAQMPTARAPKQYIAQAYVRVLLVRTCCRCQRTQQPLVNVLVGVWAGDMLSAACFSSSSTRLFISYVHRLPHHRHPQSADCQLLIPFPPS